MLAIAKAESGLNPKAQGWNCIYNAKSKACKPQDRAKAWSTDCGVFQISVKGTVCPEELWNVDVNIQKAIAKYNTKQGKRHWSVYKSGWYLAYK